MEATAHARFQRYGARKVAQVLCEIRGKSVQRAEQLLPLIQRRATQLAEKINAALILVGASYFFS